jgi:hypothetical protein
VHPLHFDDITRTTPTRRCTAICHGQTVVHGTFGGGSKDLCAFLDPADQPFTPPTACVGKFRTDWMTCRPLKRHKISFE